MVIYLLEFLLRCRKVIVVILILGSLGCLFYFSADKLIHNFVPAFINIMSDRLKVSILYSKVHYSFPGKIVLEQVQIFDQQRSPQAMVEIPQLTLGFNFPFFSAQKRVYLTQIYLDQMQIRAVILKDFIARHGSLLWSEFKALPHSDIHIQQTQTRLFLLKDEQTIAPIVFDFDFYFQKGQFKGEFKDNYSFLQFWGDWQKDRGLHWKGFMFYNGPLTPQPLHILDINGHIDIKDNDISLKDFSFSVNSDKLSATGHYSLGRPYNFQTNISFIKDAHHVTSQEPIKSIDINVKGQLEHQSVLLNGGIDLNLFSDVKLKMPLSRVNLELKDLTASVINDHLLKLTIKQTLGIFEANGREHKISLENILISFQRDKKAQFNVNLSSQLYGGQYRGKLMLDTSSAPWQVVTHGQFDNLDINRFSELMAYFNKCKGYVSGVFDIQMPQNPSLTATVLMRQTSAEDLSFLPWSVSKILQMPSLEHLSGADLFFHFKINPQVVSLDKVRLHTNDLDLSGSFRLEPNDLVASKVSVFFSQALFNESLIGQKIAQLVPKAWDLPFEFRLSGDLHRMNFQWEDSLLKKKVEQRLPNFIERSIEQRVNDKMAI